MPASPALWLSPTESPYILSVPGWLQWEDPTLTLSPSGPMARGGANRWWAHGSRFHESKDRGVQVYMKWGSMRKMVKRHADIACFYIHANSGPVTSVPCCLNAKCPEWLDLLAWGTLWLFKASRLSLLFLLSGSELPLREIKMTWLLASAVCLSAQDLHYLPSSPVLFCFFFLLEWFTAATGNQHLVLGRHGAGGDPDHLPWTPPWCDARYTSELSSTPPVAL